MRAQIWSRNHADPEGLALTDLWVLPSCSLCVCAGFGYRNNWLQVHNVQCPRGHLLHLFMLSLDTQGTIGACTVG